MGMHHRESDQRSAVEVRYGAFLLRGDLCIQRQIGLLDTDPVVLVRPQVGHQYLALGIGAADELVLIVNPDTTLVSDVHHREAAVDGPSREKLMREPCDAAGCARGFLRLPHHSLDVYLVSTRSGLPGVFALSVWRAVHTGSHPVARSRACGQVALDLQQPLASPVVGRHVQRSARALAQRCRECELYGRVGRRRARPGYGETQESESSNLEILANARQIDHIAIAIVLTCAEQAQRPEAAKSDVHVSAGHADRCRLTAQRSYVSESLVRELYAAPETEALRRSIEPEHGESARARPGMAARGCGAHDTCLGDQPVAADSERLLVRQHLAVSFRGQFVGESDALGTDDERVAVVIARQTVVL